MLHMQISVVEEKAASLLVKEVMHRVLLRLPEESCSNSVVLLYHHVAGRHALLCIFALNHTAH